MNVTLILDMAVVCERQCGLWASVGPAAELCTLSGRAMNKCFVRKATLEDAGNAIAVLRASISELCAADHKNDEATMARWLGNKTTEAFASWIYDSKNHVVVGIFEGELKGVGLIETSGDLRLCYVHPDRQRVGIARLVVAELEAQARQWGVSEIRLTSSANARGFYEHLGYLSAGEPIHEFGVLWDFPYRKTLLKAEDVVGKDSQTIAG